ncbi:MAG: hypothetical protein HUK23_02970, partial [Sphaerochaetaceae bacterium]|nr:hypothetical protein [Sphaerochaetaceae bacterium]
MDINNNNDQLNNEENKKDDAKAFWKETPFDEMQHVKPDSFAGLEGGSSDNKDNKNDKKGDSDSYWRPRSASDNKNNNQQKNGNDYFHPNQNPGGGNQGNGPFKSKKNKLGLVVFVCVIIAFAITMLSSNNGISDVSYTSFKGAVEG